MMPVRPPRAPRTPFALLLIAALLGGCAHERDDGAAEAPPAVVNAETAAVVSGPFTEVLDAIGEVEPRAGHDARLSAPGAGRIADVLVTTGQRVARDQALVALEAAPFETAARSAVAAVAAAKQARDRAQRLVDQGISPRRDLEQADADLARARADSAVAARAAELATLRAPFAGVVTRMDAAIGASVDPSQPLVEVADPGALDVVLQVSPADAGRLHTGADVALYRGQEASGEALAHGSVTDIGGIVDTVSRTVGVRVHLAPAASARIGETLFARITVATRPHALTVPPEALVPEGDGYKVFVVDSAGVAHGTTVTVGGRTASTVEITSGLTAGDRVVTRGAFGVDDGARIASGHDSTTTPS
jgi:cobalt-zinc-cadmium efflux system membrane fusion protein